MKKKINGITRYDLIIDANIGDIHHIINSVAGPYYTSEWRGIIHKYINKGYVASEFSLPEAGIVEEFINIGRLTDKFSVYVINDTLFLVAK